MLFNGLFLPPPSLASPSAQLMRLEIPKCNAALLFLDNKEVPSPSPGVEVGLVLLTPPVEVLLNGDGDEPLLVLTEHAVDP